MDLLTEEASINTSIKPQSCSPFKQLVNVKQEDEMEILGYRQHKWKNALVIVGCILTVGFLRLIFYWKPAWMLICTHVQCPLNAAQKVLLKDPFDQNFVETVQTMTRGGIPVKVRTPHTSVFYRKKKDSYIDESKLNAVITNEALIKYFFNKKLKYMWNEIKGAFEKLSGLESDVSYYTGINSGSHQPASSSFLHKAHPLTEVEAAKVRIIYGLNAIPVHVNPTIKLVLEQIFNPFYIFQFFSMILWYYEIYVYYASCLIVISAISISFTVYTTRQMQRSLKNTVQGFDSVNVCRVNSGGHPFLSMRSEYLVPGDIIELPRDGCVMQCDAVLLNGNCIVDESMLTGESVPVMKTPLPYKEDSDFNIDMKDHARHILFCGTHVIQTRPSANQSVRAIIIRTGFMTAKGDLVRSIMFPKPVDFKFYRDTYKFIGFLASCAFCGMVFTIVLKVYRGDPADEIVVRTLDLLTIAVPPVLPATLTLGVIMAQARLRRKLIYCIQPSSINIAGSVNAVCFDKTGTLTEDGLDIWGIVANEQATFLEAKCRLDKDSASHLLYGMASCHSLTYIANKLSGDPLDLKMFEATGWELEEPLNSASRNDIVVSTLVRPMNTEKVPKIQDKEIGIVRQFTFSSGLQRMSVIVHHLNSPNFDIYIKGSPEMVASLSLPETVPPNFFDMLAEYTTRGYRVIALAHRPLLMKYARVQAVQREDVEKDLQFLGLLIMENKLKPETAPVISELFTAGIRTVMVTGDNMLTAISVAKECGLIQPKRQIILVSALPPAGSMPALIEYHCANHKTELGLIEDGSDYCEITMAAPSQSFVFAITGKSWAVLRRHFPDELRKVVVRGAVYARMAPEQKAQLVEMLQELGYYVGMCGDGANDCGALKVAHAGISLSEAEASIASPFTSKKPNISCVPQLIKEGRAALVTSFGIFKLIACYSLNQFVSVLILYWIGSNLTDLEFLYEDLIIITIFSITFGRTPAYKQLHHMPPLVSLSSFQPVFSLLLVTCVSASIQVFAYFWIQMQPWFQSYESLGNSDYSSYENVAIFYIAIFQLVGQVIMFSRGHPYRKTLFRNYAFLANLAIMLMLNTWIVLYPLDFMVDILKLMPPPPIEFRAALLGLAIGNVVLFILIDLCWLEAMYFRTCIRWCKHRARGSGRPYENIEAEIASFCPGSANWPPVEEGRDGIADVLQREASYADLVPENAKNNNAARAGTQQLPSKEKAPVEKSTFVSNSGNSAENGHTNSAFLTENAID